MKSSIFVKNVALIQARFDSTRLPGKVLEDFGGRPVLGSVVRAARAIPGVDEVVVATSDEPSDDPIAEWCERTGVPVFRGSKNDVLARLADAARHHKADNVLRLTADCPLLDPQICGAVLFQLESGEYDYVTNTHPQSWPDGLDCEALTRQALEKAAQLARLPSHREHVTPFIRANRNLFRQTVVRCPLSGLENERWTLDTNEDLSFLRELSGLCPLDHPPSYTEILRILHENPKLSEAHKARDRDRGGVRNMLPDVDKSEFRDRSYNGSAKMLERAERTIPLGTQTFSKSKLIFPSGKAPLFLTHGKGAQVWDIDGNAYVDYISALLPTILGNCDPDVDAAIVDQLSRGISFSLATELEAELAERLVRIIPCAEKVRFGKNGTDATSAAIRLSRAYTGRDRVAVAGYHGWQDWYIGSTTRHKGVPDAVRSLTSKFTYGDLGELEALLSSQPGEFAAIILEPVTFTPPPGGYLEGVVSLGHDHGAVVIFDEIITGFRLAMGGAQEYFSVTPDLATVGKSMANGMPISAVVGRADIMDQMEEVFYSGTFGGEALSLAAAIATIDKIERENVLPHLWSYGDRLADEVTGLIGDNGLGEILKLAGYGPWKQLAITPAPSADIFTIRTFLMRQLLDHGILMGATHNICFAHDAMTMALTLAAYDHALQGLAQALETGDLEAQLDCKKVQPVFSVRSAAE